MDRTIPVCNDGLWVQTIRGAMTDTRFQKHVQERLAILAGLQLTIARDAADMKVFHFGTIRPARSGRGTVGACALHVQCPWRIVSDDAVVTGSFDRYEPAHDAGPNDEDTRSGTLQRVRLAGILQGYDEATRSMVNSTDRLVVLSIEADRYGGLTIVLSGGYGLQLFPSGSTGEDWRFFETDGKPHLVVEAGRAEEIE